MTAASKTERQLIDSIRKAKTGSEARAQANLPPGTKASPTPSQPEAKAAAPAKAPTPVSRTTPRAKTATSGARRTASDDLQRSGFARGRRVWPD